MSGWLVLLILAVMVVVSVIIVVVTRRDETRREEQRRRFEISDTGQRLPLAAEKPAAPPPTIDEIPAAGAREGDTDRDEEALQTLAASEETLPPRGRFVSTPDGETLLTDPPFKRREAIFSKRHGRYALALTRRLPPWLVVCPKVRLDTLVLPTSPDGRDPQDWRDWRRRVRLRCVDLVLIDRRTWSPLLGIMLERDHPTGAATLGGGKDRVIDEVLAAVELPLLRATGSFKNDWPAIRPYVEQAMLPGTEDSDREPVLGGPAWDTSAVVKLLSLDDERGGLLE